MNRKRYKRKKEKELKKIMRELGSVSFFLFNPQRKTREVIKKEIIAN